MLSNSIFVLTKKKRLTKILRNRLKTYLVFSFLMLFLGYFASISFFYHSHLVLGDTIVHSHPFKADSNGKPLHSHSDKGYVSIQLISSVIATALIAIFSLTAVLPVISEIVSIYREVISFHSYHFNYSLRGPPQSVPN